MKFGKSKPELPSFQITPMLDVVFLLLCFFVTTSVYSQWENEVQIQLPTASSDSVPDRLPGEIIINIDEAGSIIVNGRTLSEDELRNRCRTLARQFPGHPVIIRADKRTTFENTMKVLNACAESDIWNISFATSLSAKSTSEADPAPAAVH